MEVAKAVWPEEGPSEALGSRRHGRSQLCSRGKGEGSRLGHPWRAWGWGAGSRPDLWGHLLLELCCPPQAIQGTALWPASSLQVCTHYLALPLDIQGPHLYANHPWGPSQQGYTENLHFSSLKLALQVSGELTRCPIGAHRKAFPSGRQCRHQRRPSGAGCAHRCCFPAAHLGGGGAAQHRLQGFLKSCHLALEMRVSGPLRPRASPGCLVPRAGGRPHRHYSSCGRRGEQQPGAVTAPPGSWSGPPSHSCLCPRCPRSDGSTVEMQALHEAFLLA